ncbi:MAG: lysophospholipid acyltransferase family protein [Eubacteriales bacterium]|nr:lysophospholipid acyltransferase family protein [Eubacteriales bacterium]
MFFVWFVKITSAPFLFIYFKLKLIGKKSASKIDGKTIIIANHISTWDAVLVNYVFPTKRIYFMTASELFNYNKLFAWFLRTLGAFPVNRCGTDLTALSQAIDVLEQDKILGMFPEGRRSLNGELLPFKAGVVIAALNSQTPILPVYISGKYGFFRRMTVVVGEKIFLHKYCAEKHPSPDIIQQLSDMLRDKMMELAQNINIRTPKRALEIRK